MKKFIVTALAAATVLGAQTARAEDISVAALVGTTGIGLQAGMALTERTALRFGAHGGQRGHDTTADGVNYDLDFKTKTVDILLDWHPSAGSFRVTGGAVYNGNKFDGAAQPAGTSYVFNGRTYPSSSIGSVNAKVDFRKVAPYIGFGWGNGISNVKGWGITSDIGVMFTGKPRADVTYSSCTGTLCNQLVSDLNAQEAKLRDELDSVKFYPVIRIGASYKF